ncbi:unnamed protein product [Nippostrongylus brasiliensis]|uniref:Secreted protein n=1 Tax=Nippostrongylus brasiliensis TaxID=27835 RepID=A0A0N4XDR9_NIPBR|nr:unnamed protein product [Nippostrongylus brasiliensis]
MYYIFTAFPRFLKVAGRRGPGKNSSGRESLLNSLFTAYPLRGKDIYGSSSFCHMQSDPWIASMSKLNPQNAAQASPLFSCPFKLSFLLRDDGGRPSRDDKSYGDPPYTPLKCRE